MEKAESSSPLAKRRLFVGTFLQAEDQARLGVLKASAPRLSAFWERKLRFVLPAKLHLTWLFIGEVDEDAANEASARLADALKSFRRLSLSYDRAVFWPSPRGPRQFVLLAETVPPEVLAMAQAISSSLKWLAGKDDRPFVPHITLLRFGPGHRRALAVPEWLQIADLLPVHQSIEEVCLIESCQTGYRILRRFALC